MSFKPIGGFPSLIKKENAKISEKTLESRGFATTNIVSINNIMDSKKKENLFIAFGTEEEDGTDFFINDFITENPYEYNNISYTDIPLKLNKNFNRNKK